MLRMLGPWIPELDRPRWDGHGWLQAAHPILKSQESVLNTSRRRIVPHPSRSRGVPQVWGGSSRLRWGWVGLG